jgi:hypothetical protein
MKKVFRIILTGLAICTIAIPDMGSELLRKIRGNIRDLQNKTTDGINDLAQGLGKSSTEKTH